MNQVIKIFFFHIILISCLSRISYTDIKSKELENLWIIMILPAAFCFSVPLAERILGLLLGIVFLKFIAMGDVMLISSLGFVVGIKNALKLLCCAFLLSGAFSILMLVLKKRSLKDYVAFAPFIYMGVLFLMFDNIFCA